MYSQPSHAGLASLVQSRGRGDDTMLVHMTPSEVHGLQNLALAHGGSLTVNPETGLYEAGWLSKLLPTLIGFALAPLTAGTSLAFLGSPLGAGLAVGGVEALRTGDLGKGLMAGLGAFGGAGLGAGLSASSAAGTAGAAETAAAGAGPTLAASAPTATGQAILNAGQTAGSTLAGVPAAAAPAPTGFFNTMGRGVSNLASKAGREAFVKAVPGGMTGITAGGMGIANALTPDYQQPDLSNVIDESYYQSYGYDPAQGRFLGGQWQKGYPNFPRPGYAQGGMIPQPNFNYPQAGITRSNYAAPLQYNRPQELLDGYEPKINPFTGEERFDEGGLASLSKNTGPIDITGAQLGSSAVNTMMRRPTDPGRADPTTAPAPTMQDYYKGLLAPPQPKPSNASFMDYMSGLNKFVTSPVAAPKPAAPPTTTNPPTTTPPKTNPPTGDMGGLPQFTYNPMTGEPMDLSSILGNLPGMDNRMVYDRNTGKFTQPTTSNPTPITGTNSPLGAPAGYENMPDQTYGQAILNNIGNEGFNNYFDRYGMGFAEGGDVEYAAGGKFLRGPGDGMSDDIRANIEGRQEARLADGEFVVPADVVSHLGNGSSEAGSRKLYKMMDKVRHARTGRKRQAPAVKAEKYLPR